MIITLHNKFHGTSVTVTLPDLSEPEAWARIQSEAERGGASEKSRLDRVLKTLCGQPSCNCMDNGLQ